MISIRDKVIGTASISMAYCLFPELKEIPTFSLHVHGHFGHPTQTLHGANVPALAAVTANCPWLHATPGNCSQQSYCAQRESAPSPTPESLLQTGWCHPAPSAATKFPPPGPCAKLKLVWNWDQSLHHPFLSCLSAFHWPLSWEHLLGILA